MWNGEAIVDDLSNCMMSDVSLVDLVGRMIGGNSIGIGGYRTISEN